MAKGAPARNAAISDAAVPARRMIFRLMPHTDLPRWRVSHAVDRAVIVVRQQHRPVFQPFHVNRTSDIIIVLEKSGYKGLDRLDCSIRIEQRNNDIAADFLAFVPRAVARNEDSALVLLRKHLPGVEPHTERCAMRPELRDRLCELVAAVAPAELRIGNVAAVAIGKAEIILLHFALPISPFAPMVLG